MKEINLDNLIAELIQEEARMNSNIESKASKASNNNNSSSNDKYSPKNKYKNIPITIIKGI